MRTTTRGPLLIVAAGFLVESCACDSVCYSTISITAHLTESPEMLSGSSVKFCRNSLCTVGTFATVSSSNATDIVTMGDFETQAVAAPDSGGVSVEEGIIGGGGYATGDIYSITIADATGTTVFEQSATADYADSNVCDMDCEASCPRPISVERVIGGSSQHTVLCERGVRIAHERGGKNDDELMPASGVSFDSSRASSELKLIATRTQSLGTDTPPPTRRPPPKLVAKSTPRSRAEMIECA